MGSEERGVSKTILKRADVLAKIPMRGNINSLNVSVASAIVIAEAARQRWG
jgi:23S rRNA (guanosine2251-2'-O)-methyltransferase